MNKIFFFDIDGTLGTRGHIPDYNIEVLKTLKRKGYLTFICTGRAPYYAQNLFQDLVSGYITCNGRYILYEGKKLHGEIFHQEELDIYLKTFHELDCGYMLVSDDCAYVDHMNDQQIDEVQKEYGKERIVFEQNDLPFYTFDLFYHDLDHRDHIAAALKEKIVFNDHGGHGSGDCSTIGFDKGHAIAFLLNYFHIDRDHAYAFGDGYNDQAMFREVNHRIAMGNAVKELKEKATYITTSVNENGIYHALVHEKILK